MAAHCRFVIRACLLGGALFVFYPSTFADEPATRPKLAVLVVFDQMRGDYLGRWEKLFGPSGFRRLQEDGAWFQNCHYPYALTTTGPGHAALLTGTWPARHGIVDNEWYDRSAAKLISCVASERYQRVPPAVEEKDAPMGQDDPLGDKKPKGNGSPELLLVPTFGDAIKEATGGKAKVVSISFKDRSAILLASRHPDACYWLDASTGEFVTSTYYREALHAWVDEYNRGRPADRWFGKDWRRLVPDLDYERYAGPDDVAGEGKGIAQGRTFPHSMTGGRDKLSKNYYAALYNSPFGNELILQLVERAIEAEKLGQREVPDLLSISFSCNDPIGHCWGPDSQEVLDVTLRSDLIIKELLATLDARVGKDRYILCLSADHGVCPLPEVSQAQGREADRISLTKLVIRANDYLTESCGNLAGKDKKTRWIDMATSAGFYLNRAALRDGGLEVNDVADTLAAWLKQQPGILTSYSASKLSGVDTPADSMLLRSRRSFRADRSGDVVVVLKPYYLFTSALLNTSHGSPHPYDTHVPLLVFGPGVHKGKRGDEVWPQAIPAILARSLGIKPPAAAEAPLPDGLFD
jgi:hypothetical protein